MPEEKLQEGDAEQEKKTTKRPNMAVSTEGRCLHWRKRGKPDTQPSATGDKMFRGDHMGL